MLPILLLATAASAYTTARTSSGAVPVWDQMPVHYVLDLQQAPSHLDPDAVAAALTVGLQTWEGVEGADIDFTGEVGQTGPDDVDRVRFEPDWTWDPELVAMTFTHATVDGEILGFEIVLNGTRDWGIGEGSDIQSVVVHEAGHALGIGHSQVKEAAMFAVLGPEEVRRELHADDEEAARFLYQVWPEDEPLACSTGPTAPSFLWPLLLLPLIRFTDNHGGA